jgi:hypothetical protein
MSFARQKTETVEDLIIIPDRPHRTAAGNARMMITGGI